MTLQEQVIQKYGISKQMKDLQALTQVIQDLTQELEEHVFKICIFKTDENYQRKINNILENIRFLANPTAQITSFREFCVQMFIKRVRRL